MTKIEPNNIDEVGKEYFQLPIYHLTDKIETDQNVIKDLELVEYKDVSNNNLYQDIIDPYILGIAFLYYTCPRFNCSSILFNQNTI